MKSIDIAKGKELEDRLVYELPGLFSDLDFTVGSVRRETRLDGSDDPQQRIDILADVKLPNNKVQLAIEVKNTDRLVNVREAAYQIKRYTEGSPAIPIVAGLYIGERARDLLRDEGVGYLDLAGNIYFARNSIYVERVVDKNPFTTKPPLKNIFAPTSSRIARAMLIEPKRAWTVSDLYRAADVSLGQTHKVLEAMRDNELATRDAEGKWTVTNPTALLEAWKKVYPTYQNKLHRMFSYERNEKLPGLIVNAGKEANLLYALGFFSGADLIAPFIRGLSKVQLYTTQDAVETWKNKLELKEVDNGGNIELYVPYDAGVFYKTQQCERDDGTVNIVSNVQLYMDLFNDPARGEEAAEHLREVKLGF